MKRKGFSSSYSEGPGKRATRIGERLTVTQIWFVDQPVFIFGVIEGWPSATRLVFTGRREEFFTADYACIHSIIFQSEILSGKRTVASKERERERKERNEVTYEIQRLSSSSSAVIFLSLNKKRYSDGRESMPLFLASRKVQLLFSLLL